jgi:hypothetical protein
MVLLIIRLVEKRQQRLSSTSTDQRYSKSDLELGHNPARVTPNWNWANEQYRHWLRVLYNTYLGLSVGEAVAISLRFEGFRPNVYLMKIEEWEELLGETKVTGVYWWLLSVRHTAVPKHINIAHGWISTRKEDQVD